MTSDVRFGLIVTLIAKEQILPGEEVTVNYNYHQTVAPAWYKEVHSEETANDPSVCNILVSAKSQATDEEEGYRLLMG